MTRMLMTNNAPPRLIKSAPFGKAKFTVNWLRATVTDPNSFIVIAFCAIGLFVTLLVAFLGGPT